MIGHIAVVISVTFSDWSSASFVGGILPTYDTGGYIIISDSTTAGVVGRTTGNNTVNPINSPLPNGTELDFKPTFWVSDATLGKTSSAFLDLVNRLPPTLDNNGFNTPTTTPAGGRPFFDNNDPGSYNLPSLPNFPYTNAYDAAKDWLNVNGYWTSYT